MRRSADGRKVVSHATIADRSFFIPGTPTLHALKDPDAPAPILLDRETYLLNRAGLHPGNSR